MRTTLFLITLIGLLAGCEGLTDPYQRAGTWNPSGANEANLRVMVDEPADLEHGRGERVAAGQTAVVAIERLRAGRVRSLPDTGVANVTPVSTGSSNGAAAQ